MKEAETGESGPAVLFGGGSRIRFEVLLGAFALYFVCAAVAEPLGINTGGRPARLLSTAALVILLSAAALTVSARRAARYALLVFLLLVTGLIVLSRFQPRPGVFDVVAHGLGACFVAWVSILIIRGVWALRAANAEAIAAALCAFLLIGMFWTQLYSMIGHLDPGAFAPHDMRIGESEPLTPFYYSFVTLTTLGYGDIVPKSASARALAILEAIVGQIYLVVLVARLVGLSIPARPPSSGS